MNKRSEKAIVAIYKGLFSLLSKENFDKITVRAICKESKVNKMTFYKYYKDKYDALSKSFQYFVQYDFTSEFGEESVYIEKVGSEEGIYNAISYLNSWCKKHALQIHNVFTTQNGLPYDIVKSAILTDYEKFVSSFLDPEIFPVNHEYFSSFIFSGFMCCIEIYLNKLRVATNVETLDKELDEAAHFFAKGWVAVYEKYAKVDK